MNKSEGFNNRPENNITFSRVVSPDMIDGLNHANYLKSLEYFNEVQSLLREQMGISLETLKEQNLALVVSSLGSKYFQELFLGEEVKIKGWVVRDDVRKGVVRFTAEVTKKDRIAIRCSVEMALISLETKAPVDTPEWFNQIVPQA